MSRAHQPTRPIALKTAVAAILSASALAGALPVYAQEQSQKSTETLEEITVTGSRIVRKDFEATSPIVTVGVEQFENTSTLAIEANLNKLPQFVPAVTQFVTQDVQNTATNTVGASSVSLRGLGPNRNLVLLDGRRAMPVNASMVVDVNSIPSAAIQRVEVITGGASSVYGADAVGGVVNFILKKDFNGVEIDSQYNMTELGDGQELRVTGLVGGNFADGRGNAMFGLEHYRRDEAAQIDRDFYLGRMRDPTVAPTEFFYSDSAYVPGFTNTPNQTVVNGVFSQATAAVPSNGTFYVNRNGGTLYTGGNTFGAGNPAGVYRYNGILDGQFRRISADGTIGEFQQNNLVSTPLRRSSMFGRGSFKITDSTTFFVQGNFNKNDTESILQYSPASNGWSVMIPHGTGVYAPSVDGLGNTLLSYQAGGSKGLNCPATGGCTNSQAFPVSPELQQLLDSRANPNAPWQLNRVLDFLGPRGSVNSSLNYQILAGFNGDLPVNDWTWEVYTSHGETSVQIGLRGFGDLQRYRAIVTQANYGRGAFLPGNQGAPGFGFAAATGNCTSGLPIFGEFAVSGDCLGAIRADLQNNTNMKQNVVEGNLQGKLAELPWGDLRFALGADWRENTFRYQTDILTSQQSFLDGAIGLFPAGNSEGSTSAKEVYAEFLVPVLKDIPGFQRLDIELGYRYSDYDTLGGVSTYKALIDWVTTDWLRVRGGHQLASRAPNIGELYLARTMTVTGTSYGDPCSRLSTLPSSPNPALNSNAAQAEAICRALMGPAGAASFYAQPQAIGRPGIYLANTVGNVDLLQEEARSYTLGIVFTSPWDAPMARKLRLSLDWYSIDIQDAIGALSVDTVHDLCLNARFNPTFSPTAPACAGMVRDPNTGGPGPTDVFYSNQGRYKTAGIDAQIDWGFDVGSAGSLNLNFLVNWIDEYTTQASPTAPVVDWKNTLGPTTPGLNPGVYRYKAFTNVSYLNPSGFGATLRWRFLPSVRSAAAGPTPNTLVQGAGSYSMFDLNGSWRMNDTLSLRYGIDNLFDTEPEVVNRNPAQVMSGGSFDTLPGYYDVLGRRYYLGFKANF